MDAEILKSFNAFSLQELDSNNLLMNTRFESKYLFHNSLLNTLLEKCKSCFNILSIDDIRLFDYQNDYFDTPAFQLYFDHHRQKSLRYKIRKRTYKNSGVSVVEIKKKTPDGISHKFRNISPDLESSASLIQANSFIKITDLKPSIISSYKRITLMNKLNMEKVTIDISLNFEFLNQKIIYNNIAIAEVKSAQLHKGDFETIMKSLGVRPGGISKYCLGVISLHPEIKHNNFKQVYKQILKLNSNDRY